MCVLQSAVVLVWAIAPPAVRHVHDGGNDPSHRHVGAASTATGSGRHDFCNEHYLAYSALGAGLTTAAFVRPGDTAAHLHFELFGLHVALPDSQAPLKPGENQSESQLVYAPTIENMGALSPLKVSIEKFLASVWHDGSIESVTDLAAVPVYSHPVTTVLLCDRARHERSGVQLG